MGEIAAGALRIGPPAEGIGVEFAPALAKQLSTLVSAVTAPDKHC